MPIVGLTDQLAALPIIGELRKGEKKVSDKRPGIDLTYFRMTSTYGDVVTDFYSHYDEKPRVINAYLPYEKADQNFDAWMEEWVAGGLVHRCDGHTVTLWRTPKGNYSTEPKPCPGNCKQVGRLSIIVPELGRYATVTVLTTSIHDIKNLMRQLRMYESMSGDLRGVPFVIRRSPYQISTPGPDGKRLRREKWLLSIETKPEWTKAKMLEVANQAMPQLPEPESVRQIEAEYEIIEALPEGVHSPFDEVDQDTGEVFEPQAESLAGWTNLDDFLYQLHIDFALSRDDALQTLKVLGYKGFPKNGGAKAKSMEMYEAVKKFVTDAQPTE